MDFQIIEAFRRVCLPVLLGAMLSSGVGCFPAPTKEAFSDLQRQLEQQRRDNGELARKLEEQEASMKRQEQLIADLRKLSVDRFDDLVVVDRIELASLTGGADYDQRPGDDGITVYLRPLDKEGDLLKATGEIVVKLVDNSGEGEPRLLGLYSLKNPDDIRRAWHGGLLTNHYTIQCPWQRGPENLPRTEEVEIKVTFLDYLTGRSFSAHKTVKVHPAGG